MRERLRGSDYRFLAVCLTLLAGTTWFSVRNFYRAFPEASIEFRVSRDEARGIAERYLASQGYRLEGYRHASSFTFDDETKTFLEREAGLEQANRVVSSRVRLWRWSNRWFRPGQKEEYRVDITPRGELVGFEHQLPEDSPGRGLTPEAARSLAENVLRTRFDRNPAELEFLEAATIARPRRVDRVFTWKERDFDLRGADNRVAITLAGDEAGGYREYLKIPEQWTRDYERLRSQNEAAQTMDSAVLVLLIAGLATVILMRVRRGDVRWRLATAVGVAGIALSFCSSLNEFPLHEFSYPTTDSYASFVARQVLQALLGALAAGGLLFVLTAGAEPLYREALPGKISLSNLFRARALATRRFFLGAVLGITLTSIFVAYQTGFYIVAYRFGAWSPADVPYSDLLNTKFPWMFVLFGGFLPALSEELLFRMFAIPFLRKLVRSLAVAIVLAGFIWGFGHAGYPQQPFWIRGVEVGIGGIALGMIVWKWGILPALVWHYSVDAMYSAMLLLRSDSLYYRLSGAASAGILLLPVAASLVAYWRRGGFEPETGLRNEDEQAPSAEPAATAAPEPERGATAITYRPLGKRAKLVCGGLFVLGLISLLLRTEEFGQTPVYRLSQAQARSASDAFLRSGGLDPAAFRAVTFPATHWTGDDAIAGKYLLQMRGPAEVTRLFEFHRPLRHWVTRYFRPLDVESVVVSLNPETGRVLGFGHTIPEDRAGGDIPADAARVAASSFAERLGWKLDSMELKESRSERKKARRDHTLVWESRAGAVLSPAEARYRIEVGIAGDRVSSLRSYWKIPETFARMRSQQNWISITALVMRLGVLATGVIWVLLLLVQNTRAGLVRWGPASKVAIAPALLGLAGPLLALHLTLVDYNTSTPLGTFQALTFTALLTSTIFTFLMLTVADALILSFYPELTAAWSVGGRRRLGGDAAILVLAAGGLALLVSRIEGVILDSFHSQALFSLAVPNFLASAVPAVSVLATQLRTAMLYAAVLGAVALLVRRLGTRHAPLWITLAGACALLPLDVRTPGELAVAYASSALFVAAAVFFCSVLARRNYLAYGLLVWLMALRNALGELFGATYPVLQTHAWVVALCCAGFIVWAVWPALSAPRHKP